MAPLTDKGWRKSTDPIFKQASIVLGPVSKPPSSDTPKDSEPENETSDEAGSKYSGKFPPTPEGEKKLFSSVSGGSWVISPMPRKRREK